MALSLTPSKTYKLEDVALEMHARNRRTFLILEGWEHEGCVTYKSIRTETALTAYMAQLTQDIQQHGVFDVRMPEDGALPGAVSFRLGKINQEIVDKYGFISQPGPVTQVFGYSKALRDLLQTRYDIERQIRMDGYPSRIRDVVAQRCEEARVVRLEQERRARKRKA